MKTKKTKRIFLASMATVLTLALSLVSVSAATTTADTAIENNASATIETADNLFYNGNFETGDKSSWLNETKETATFTVTDEDKYDGKYSLKVEKAAAGTGAVITNYCYYAEENTVYSVSYSLKITEGTIQALPVIGQYTSDWQAIGGGAKWLGQYAKYSLTDGWVQVSFDFTTDEGTEILEFGLAANEGAGTCYFDDVAVYKKAKGGENIFCNGNFDNASKDGWVMDSSVEVPPEKKVTDYFVNGDFETTFASNSSFAYNINDAVAEFTTENVHSGTYAVKYTSGYFTNYGTSVEPGTYKLSMWVNIVSGDTAEISGFVSGCGIPWQDFAMKAVRGVTNGWVQISGDVTFTEAGTPQFGFKTYDGTGEVYIDDIALTQEYLEPLTKTTELLVNNNFANGNANWSFSGNCEIVNDNGINEIKMTVPANGSEYIQQTVSVVPGKTYDLSVDLMTKEQDGNDAQAQVYVIDSAWNVKIGSIYKSYGWQHYTATYTAPEGVTSVTILLQHNVVAGVSYWKNISFSLTEMQVKEIRENVFVNGDFETVFASNSAFAYNINDATAEFTTENVHSGTYAVKYTSGYFTNYGTSVEPGTYTLSMWVNIVSGDTAEISGFVSGCGIPWQDFAMKAVRGVTNGWVQISGDVTFTEAGTPQFGFKTYDGTGEVYIDDIKLEKITYEPIYPTTTYTEGIGTFGGDNGMLKADTKTDWWNYGTTVEEGKTYTYSMDVKIENAQPGFQFCPYIMNFAESWQQSTVYTADTDWTHYEFEFTAAAPDATNGTRFGFARNGTGTVYIDNISLKEVITSVDTDIEETIISNGNFANGTDGWELNGSYGSDTITTGEGLTGNGIIVTHTAGAGALSYKVRTANYISVEPGAVYIAKVYVKTTGNVTIGASLRANTANGGDPYEVMPTQYSGYKMSGINGWQLITYRLTVPTDITWKDGISGVKLQLDMTFEDSDATVLYDDVQMYREYAYGDANGDGVVDIRDLVCYKKAFAKTYVLVSNIYGDVDNDRDVDINDLVELCKYLLDPSKTLGPTYFK